MIGSVKFKYYDEEMTATLLPNGQWESHNFEMNQYLNEIMPVEAPVSPLQIRHELFQAAARLGGEVEFDSDVDHNLDISNV